MFKDMYRKNLGKTGENLACEYLKANKIKVLDKNYKNKIGEIDIIAKDGDTVAFIEVKTRSSYIFGTPAEAVNYKKQQKIIKTALKWMTDKNYEDDIRFDVIEVLINETGAPDINYIKNAFGG